ncbi:hypothetical protein [Alsobacter sp. SYSU BS001988]
MRKSIHPSPDEISAIRAEWERFRAWKKRQPDPTLRRAELKRFTAQCDRFIAVVKRSPFLTGTAPADVIPTLGAMLSASGFERLGGSISGPHSQGVEDVLRHAGHPGRLDTVALVRGLEQQTLPARQSAAAQMGPDLLVRLLNAVKAPAERMLELEQPPRGGRPPDSDRRVVLGLASEAYVKRTGERATVSRTGPFFRYCAEVMEALGLDTDTLDEFAPKVMRRDRKP